MKGFYCPNLSRGESAKRDSSRNLLRDLGGDMKSRFGLANGELAEGARKFIRCARFFNTKSVSDIPLSAKARGY